MFDVSFSELMVVGVVALIVIGPERLPKVAKTIGHLVGRAQRYVSDVKADIQREMELDELRKFKEQVQEASESMKSSMSEAQTAIAEPLKSFEQNTIASLQDVKQEVNDLASTVNGVPSAEASGVATVQVTDSASALAQVEAASPSTTFSVGEGSSPVPLTSDEAVKTSAVASPMQPQQLEIDALHPVALQDGPSPTVKSKVETSS